MRAQAFPAKPYDDAARAAYLKEAYRFVDHVRTLLGPYFGAVPAYGIEVAREPAFSEVAGGAAHASGPSPDGKRPARTMCIWSAP